MNEQKSGGGFGFIKGLLIGGIVGGLVGVLLAPKPGKETMAQLKEQGALWRERSNMGFEAELSTLKETVGEMQEVLKETLAEGREVFREVVAEGKDASVRATDDLQRRFQSAKDGRDS